MKVIAIALSILALAGCASLQNAGVSEYSASPVPDKNGALVCCQVTIKNGKEVAAVEAHLTKNGDAITLDLKEQGVTAFQGQAIAAGATQAAIDSAAKAAAAAALAPILPVLAPYIGGALASPGLGAAAAGAAAAVGVEKVTK